MCFNASRTGVALVADCIGKVITPIAFWVLAALLVEKRKQHIVAFHCGTFAAIKVLS